MKGEKLGLSSLSFVSRSPLITRIESLPTNIQVFDWMSLLFIKRMFFWSDFRSAPNRSVESDDYSRGSLSGDDYRRPSTAETH